MPEADELVLAATLDLELNALSANNGLGHAEVDAASDSFTWLIERLSSAQLDKAVVVLAAVSSKEFHTMIKMYIKLFYFEQIEYAFKPSNPN